MKAARFLEAGVEATRALVRKEGKDDQREGDTTKNLVSTAMSNHIMYKQFLEVLTPPSNLLDVLLPSLKY